MKNWVAQNSFLKFLFQNVSSEILYYLKFFPIELNWTFMLQGGW